MATLPDNFQFSQSAIQDYADCARRFYLRYVKELRYPAPESEPIRDFEERMELGDRFHLLVYQHQIGIAAETLRATLDNEDLELWFDRYLESGLKGLPEKRYPELALTVPLANRRLVAKFDLLAVEPDGQVVIMDWKTTPNRPTRDELKSRWQAIIYPYVLAKAGAHLYGGKAIPPAQIRMVYWFAEAAEQPESFDYDAEQFARAESRINDIAGELLGREDEEAAFPLTTDERHCKYCVYRSYTERGTVAGDALNQVDQTDPLDDLDFGLDQVAEIAF